MTLQETSASLRKLADAFDRIRREKGETNIEILAGTTLSKPMFSEEDAVAAAGFLCYLRDCFTGSPKEVWSQGELLVLLEMISRDGEIFPLGAGQLMWQMDVGDGN